MSRVHEGPEPSSSPELAAYQEQCAESVNHHLAKMCMILKAASIDEVHVIYGAGEDDGGIEEVKFFRRINDALSPVEPPQLPGTTHTQFNHSWTETELEQFCYNLMQARGYFNQNEGCQGIIRWLIAEDMMIHDHQTNAYGEGDEVEDSWTDSKGVTHTEKHRETLYIPNDVETYYGIDDIADRLRS